MKRCEHHWKAERNENGERIGPWKCMKCGWVIRDPEKEKNLDYLKEESEK